MYLQKIKTKYSINQVLRKFSDLSESTNPNETIGISKTDGFYSNIKHSLAFVFPWNLKSIEDALHLQLTGIKRENKQFGLHTECFLGRPNCSGKKITIEKDRIEQLSNSIKEKGYQIDFSNSIICSLMIYGNEWRYFINGGQHRGAILASLGYSQIPAKIKAIINRDEVNDWQAVRDGIYTKQAALKVFDQIFFATPPPLYNEWCSFVDNELR